MRLPGLGSGINGGMTAADLGVPSATSMPAGIAPSLSGLPDPHALEKSFREYMARPENEDKLIECQREEMVQLQKAKRRMEALDFREKVLSSDYESQQNVSTFLNNRLLRQFVQMLANDEKGDFSKWAKNPRVIEILTKVKEQLDDGRITEKEAHWRLTQYFKHPGNEEAHAEYKAKFEKKAFVETKDLVGALNEHLRERRMGNDFYKEHDFESARQHYKRALSIVEYVRGCSQEDQLEIDKNRVLCLLNQAAVEMQEKQFGAAISFLNRAYESEPENTKLLLRRARAYIGRREYCLAREDLDRVKHIEPLNWEVEEEMMRLTRAQAEDRIKEKVLFGSIFKP